MAVHRKCGRPFRAAGKASIPSRILIRPAVIADVYALASRLRAGDRSEVEAIGRAGDVLMGISTSGGSPNVLEAFAVAKAAGLTTVALTGRDGGRIGAAADIHINVPSSSTARVQEVHRTLMHAMCELIERELYA